MLNSSHVTPRSLRSTKHQKVEDKSWERQLLNIDSAIPIKRILMFSYGHKEFCCR